MTTAFEQIKKHGYLKLEDTEKKIMDISRKANRLKGTWHTGTFGLKKIIEIVQLKRRIKKLADYTEHMPDCSVFKRRKAWLGGTVPGPCTCGLDKLLEGK